MGDVGEAQKPKQKRSCFNIWLSPLPSGSDTVVPKGSEQTGQNRVG